MQLEEMMQRDVCTIYSLSLSDNILQNYIKHQNQDIDIDTVKIQNISINKMIPHPFITISTHFPISCL